MVDLLSQLVIEFRKAAVPVVRTITTLDLNMNIRVCCVDTEAAEDRIA
jgi:hypothetical protein